MRIAIALIVFMIVLSFASGLVDAGFDGNQIWADVRGNPGDTFRIYLHFADGHGGWREQSVGNHTIGENGQTVVKWSVSGKGQAYVEVRDKNGITHSSDFRFH